MGGAETSLVSLMASVRESRADWELSLALAGEGPLAEKAHQLGVQVFPLPFPAALARLGDTGRSRALVGWSILSALVPAVAYARRLRRLIDQIRPDVIHSNGFKMHLLSSGVRRRNTALIWHMHDYASTRPLIGRLLRRFQGRCDAIVANSKSVASDVATLYPAVPIETIYNAIDVEHFAPRGEICDLDRISGLPPAEAGTIRVGMVATFARWKGHDVFLRALSCLSPNLAVRGYLIGGPIYQTGGSQYSLAELQQKAQQLGLDGRIGFTGFLDDPATAMRSLDILVHASTEPEPFGMVIVEGMACGKAVIASRAGGAHELFVEGANALGHSPGDFRELARQVELLAGNQELRRRLGRNARAAAERVFPGKRLAGELLPLYQRVFDATNRNREQCGRAGAELTGPASSTTRIR